MSWWWRRVVRVPILGPLWRAFWLVEGLLLVLPVGMLSLSCHHCLSLVIPQGNFQPSIQSSSRGYSHLYNSRTPVNNHNYIFTNDIQQTQQQETNSGQETDLPSKDISCSSSSSSSDAAEDDDDDDDEYLYAVLNTALVQAQALMDACCSDDELLLPDTLRRLFRMCHQSVEVRQSTINNAGRGLFAMEDIPVGQIVSFYPIHAVGANHWKGQCIGATTTDDQQYFDSIDHSNYLLNLIGDRIFPGGHKLEEEFHVQPYIDTNPHRPDDCKGWMAHRINDCAILQDNTEAAILQYYEHVRMHQNCIIVPFGPAPLCAAVTTQNVPSGHELFMGYGYWYWMDAWLSQMKMMTAMMIDREYDTTTETEKSERVLTIEAFLFDEMINTMTSVEQHYADEVRELMRFFNDLS